jgi:cellulose synthase/poly-beta-1,6-N-acetylglucosamine synthase-like glycosyltransferase
MSPDHSAAATRADLLRAGAALAAIGPAAFAVPEALTTVFGVILSAIFLGWTILRLIALFTTDVRREPRHLPPNRALPVYTILVALYREATAVPTLVRALSALDYPPEKLDIKLVVEADDAATLNAIAQLDLRAPFSMVVVPPGGPRTKPKALNAALPFARGSFLAVYDAEDRPEPGQLRHALAVFLAASERLACVQARLTIDNTDDGWLTRIFTAEYAGLFDVFLPGIAAWRKPLPLGGSSNHFRTAVLHRVGAWDAHNVTEDADLGMRLARFGYQTALIDSATYEEAPARFMAWLRQRTRWIKGWMQTWLVHMRRPVVLARELGPAGFLTFQCVIGGNVLAALVHPFCVAALLWQVFAWPAEEDDAIAFFDVLRAAAFPTMLTSGYLMTVVLAAFGVARRRLRGCMVALLLMPLYWFMLSFAAWRALVQLIAKPQLWEKTTHGLARTSRLDRQNRARTPPTA